MSLWFDDVCSRGLPALEQMSQLDHKLIEDWFASWDPPRDYRCIGYYDLAAPDDDHLDDVFLRQLQNSKLLLSSALKAPKPAQFEAALAIAAQIGCRHLGDIKRHGVCVAIVEDDIGPLERPEENVSLFLFNMALFADEFSELSRNFRGFYLDHDALERLVICTSQ